VPGEGGDTAYDTHRDLRYHRAEVARVGDRCRPLMIIRSVRSRRIECVSRSTIKQEAI
jgi:hypothetical protein